MGDGREGDWECSGCKNRNYEARSFGNRCKQPRILVDTKTPADSKWLPRIGDWICTGHKAHGVKRLASEELIHEWDSKRVNLGNLQSYPGYEQMVGASGEPKTGFYAPHPSASSSSVGLANTNAVFISSNRTYSPWKGAKQWRNGDWMCTNCNNHNYASRSECNRCKTHKEVDSASQCCLVELQFANLWRLQLL